MAYSHHVVTFRQYKFYFSFSHIFFQHSSVSAVERLSYCCTAIENTPRDFLENTVLQYFFLQYLFGLMTQQTLMEQTLLVMESGPCNFRAIGSLICHFFPLIVPGSPLCPDFVLQPHFSDAICYSSSFCIHVFPEIHWLQRQQELF